jgi:hypothetical protein
MEVVAGSMDSFGELVLQVGELEDRSGLNLAELGKRVMNRDYMNALVKNLPPEQLGLFFKVILRMSTMGDLSMERMTPAQKIEAGHSLKEAASDLRGLMTSLRSVDAQADSVPEKA